MPGLEARYKAKLWGKTYDDVQGAIDAALAGLPANARVAVIPEGPSRGHPQGGQPPKPCMQAET